MMNSRRRLERAAALFSAALIVLLSACRAAGPGTNQQWEIHRSYKSGILELRLSVDRSVINTAQHLLLRAEGLIPEQAAAPGAASVQLTLAEDGGSLGGFRVRDARHHQELRDGFLRVIEERKLEPQLPGSYSIPPVRLLLGGGPEAVSEPFSISVESLLPSDPGDLDDILGARPLPRSKRAELIVLAAALILIAMFFALKRFIKRPLPQLSAAEVALRRLEDLAGGTRPSGAEAALFYAQLTQIVREYVEARCGTCAPAQTTEEFLDAIAESPEFSAYRLSLAEFLGSCDLVKFARHLPEEAEAAAAVESARNFIKQCEKDREASNAAF